MLSCIRTSKIYQLQIYRSRHLLLRRSFTNFDSEYFETVDGAAVYHGPQAKLKGRDFLPGSMAETFPTHLRGPREDFPIIFRLKKSSLRPKELGSICRQKLDTLFPKYSAVVFRGLPLTSADEFDEYYEGCNYGRFNYVGGSAVREKIRSQIYNASVEPASYNIELHNEMSYSPIHNQKIMLFCLTAPKDGGLSPICENRDIFEEMDEKFIIKLRKYGIAYYRNSENNEDPGTFSWQNAFETNDKKEAEYVMKSRGMQWKWMKNDRLRFWYKLNAFTRHPETGEELFFNQVHSHHCSYYKSHPDYMHLTCDDIDYPFHCTYGNGDEFEAEFIQAIRESGWRNAVGIPWQQGDVAVLDNMVAQHSRLSFTGKRKILVGLSAGMVLDSPDEEKETKSSVY